MDATVAWSWSQIGHGPRDLLAVASTFRSDFTLASLEAMLVPDPVPVQALDELVSHSLLQKRPGPDAGYHVLDAIRAHVRTQLSPARRRELQLGHARLVVARSEDHMTRFLRGGYRGAGPASIRSADDLHAAYHAATEAGDLPLAARAAIGQATTFAWLGLIGSARQVTVDAWATADALDDELWARLATLFLSLLGEVEPFTDADVARLAAIATSTSSPLVSTRALRILAVRRSRHDQGGAIELGAAAIAAARSAGLQLELGFSLGNQAKYLQDAGRWREALAAAEEAVRVSRMLDVPVANGTSLTILASCQIAMGDLHGADQTLRSATAWTRNQDWNSVFFGDAMAVLAGVQLVLGRLREAEALLDEADALMARVGDLTDPHRTAQGNLLLARAFLAELRGQPRAALDALERAQLAFGAIDCRLEHAVTWSRIAWASAELGRGAAASAALERARELGGDDAPAWFATLLAIVGHRDAGSTPPGEGESLHLRLARAVLGRSAGPGAGRRYVLADQGRELIDPTGRRVALRGRRAVKGILRALAAAAPEILSVDDLFRAVWPGQVATHESARNRVYVSVSALRRLVGDTVVQSADSGYRLAPGVEIVEE